MIHIVIVFINNNNSQVIYQFTNDNKQIDNPLVDRHKINYLGTKKFVFLFSIPRRQRCRQRVTLGLSIIQ